MIKNILPSFKGKSFSPMLRGWIHLVATPLTLVATIVLACLSPNWKISLASLVFMLCTLSLFGISALYHRFNWKEKTRKIMRALDHSNIFLLIAGSYTVLVSSLLDSHYVKQILPIVWIGAIIGIIIYVFFPNAPRVFNVSLYILLGWVAIWYMKPIYLSGGIKVVVLLIAGGLSYSMGAVFYAMKSPGKNARYFGYHEYFHLFTVFGWTFICIASYISVLSA